MGAPYVKKFVEERDLTLLLLVDLSGSQRFGSRFLLKRDYAAELAAVLAFSAVANHDRVGAVLFTDRIEAYVPPRPRPRPRAAHRARPAGRSSRGAAAPTSRARCASPRRVLKRRGIVAVISDFQDEGYERPLGILRRRHDVIALQLSDPREADVPARRPGRAASTRDRRAPRRRHLAAGGAAAAAPPAPLDAGPRRLPAHAGGRAAAVHGRVLRAAAGGVLQGAGAAAMSDAAALHRGAACSRRAARGAGAADASRPRASKTERHGGRDVHGRGDGERPRRARRSTFPGEARRRDGRAARAAPAARRSSAAARRRTATRRRCSRSGDVERARRSRCAIGWPTAARARSRPRPIPLRVASVLPKDPKEQKLADIRGPVSLAIGRAFWIAAGARSARCRWRPPGGSFGGTAAPRPGPRSRRAGAAPGRRSSPGALDALASRRACSSAASTARSTSSWPTIAKRYLERRLRRAGARDDDGRDGSPSCATTRTAGALIRAPARPGAGRRPGEVRARQRALEEEARRHLRPPARLGRADARGAASRPAADAGGCA